MTTTQPEWHFLGPEHMPNGYTSGTSRVPVSGRIAAIAVDPSDSNHLLCGSAAGGIWESHSRGASWAPRTDFMPTLTTGALAFDPGNPAIVYAGTGEGNAYSSQGQGILRSTDGGTTWALLTAGPFTGKGFYRLIVDPANGQHLLAATTAGLHESTDGGATWSLRWGALTWDISMQPGGGPAAEVLAASSTGLLRSTDGGHTWAKQALPGAPASWARLAVSLAPSDSSTAFAFGASTSPVTAYLWQRSGGAWSALATPAGMVVNQASYDWVVAAAPDTAGQVYLGATDGYRGDLASGTWTWTRITTKNPGDSIHQDLHAIAFDANAPGLVYVGCDGGLFRSLDRGTTWISLNCGLGITEVESIALDNSNPRFLLAGNQDNGAMRYLGTSAFDCVAGGDGGDCGIDPASPGTCYITYVYMGLKRFLANDPLPVRTSIGPKTPSGYVSSFYAPVEVNGATVAQAGQSVFVSRDQGTTWTEVLLPAGTAGMKTTAMHMPTSDLIYAATNTGRIFSIAYSGGAWPTTAVELTSPRAARVSAIMADPSIASRIWVTISQTGGGRVFRSDDGGTTWTDKTAGLPGLPINSVAVDTTNSDRVWVSADLGVYQSLDGGGIWSAFYQNLPHAIVTDLKFHPAARLLRAATHNRGIWEVKVDQPGSSVLPQGLKVCTALLNADGTLEVFGVGTDRTLQHIRQDSSALNGWGSWASLSGTLTSAVTGAVNQDGRLEVFARGPDGALWHASQGTPGSGWSAWYSLGGFLTGDPTVAPNQDGRLEVFARGQDGSLVHNSQTTTTPGGSWSGWASLGGVLTSAPAVARNADGRLEAIVQKTDGSAYHIWQTTAGGSYTPGGSWSEWASLSGTLTSAVTGAVNQDGRLVVFALGTDGALWHAYQGTAGGNWSAWLSLGGSLGYP